MCDTFIALAPVTADGSVIFGKNSDREPNEAQALEFHPPNLFPAGTELRCTYMTIPQARATKAVLLSRPFWMWGAEMGANEKDVVIGNEAVFTRMPYERQKGLTGMDLLRLALERAGTAEEALETIIRLLADYGQGGVCGYKDQRLIYHNSYIIADPNGAWVLETAGRLWAALKVQKAYAISNGLTIGENYERLHPDAVTTAQKMGRLKQGRTFNFAACYSDRLFTTFSACRKRRSRALELIEKHATRGLGMADAFALLRDHGGQAYRPDRHFLTSHICAHAGNGLTRNSGSTASLAAQLHKDRRIFWATGTAAPCTGIFKPIHLSGKCLPDLGPTPGRLYDESSLWWRHENFHRQILHDLETRLKIFDQERDQMEKRFITETSTLAPEAFFDFSRTAFERADAATAKWLEEIRSNPIQRPNGLGFRHYWKKQNREAAMPEKTY